MLNKKIISILLAVSMAVGLTGCSASSKGADTGGKSGIDDESSNHQRIRKRTLSCSFIIA